MQTSILTLALVLAFFTSTAIAQQKTLPYNFTLAALNTTLPNANDTGAPLVLGYEGMKGITTRSGPNSAW